MGDALQKLIQSAIYFSMPKKINRQKKATLLGLGLDNEDGHTRITTGENFKLFGGSQETHGAMQEQVIKMNEQLKDRGKTLDNVSRDEFVEIAHKVGMPLLESKKDTKQDRN